jgi:hypothetical protein
MNQVTFQDRTADEDLDAINRRDFLKHVSGSVLAVCISGVIVGCSSDDSGDGDDDDDDEDEDKDKDKD